MSQDDITMLSQNVGNQISTDYVSHHRRTDPYPHHYNNFETFMMYYKLDDQLFLWLLCVPHKGHRNSVAMALYPL
jgi:hypothetical protein